MSSWSTIMFPSSLGTQWTETRHTCSLQFALPRANLHWFTSFYWPNMNICCSITLCCSVDEHNLILWLRRKPMNTKRRVHLALTSQEILIALHQVRGQHQWVVGGERRLQLTPQWSSVPKDKSWLHLQHFSTIEQSSNSVLPGESPAGPWTGTEFQRCVITNLLSSADWSRLQDMLH